MKSKHIKALRFKKVSVAMLKNIKGRLKASNPTRSQPLSICHCHE